MKEGFPFAAAARPEVIRVGGKTKEDVALDVATGKVCA